MAEPAVQLDDGMTDAERHFFQSGGDVNEDLLKQQKPRLRLPQRATKRSLKILPQRRNRVSPISSSNVSAGASRCGSTKPQNSARRRPSGNCKSRPSRTPASTSG